MSSQPVVNGTAGNVTSTTVATAPVIINGQNPVVGQYTSHGGYHPVLSGVSAHGNYHQGFAQQRFLPPTGFPLAVSPFGGAGYNNFSNYNGPKPIIPANDVRADLRVRSLLTYKIREGVDRRELEIFLLKLKDFNQAVFGVNYFNAQLTEKTAHIYSELANIEVLFQLAAEYDLPFGNQLFQDAFERLFIPTEITGFVIGPVSREDPRFTEKFKMVASQLTFISPECGFTRSF